MAQIPAKRECFVGSCDDTSTTDPCGESKGKGEGKEGILARNRKGGMLASNRKK